MVPEGALPILARVDERSGRRLARSTAIFSLATGLSRILGLVREVVAAYYFGAAGKINAFTVAFQVPNLIRALVADALRATDPAEGLPAPDVHLAVGSGSHAGEERWVRACDPGRPR